MICVKILSYIPAQKLGYIGYHNVEAGGGGAVAEPVLEHRAVAAGSHHLGEVEVWSKEVGVAIDVGKLFYSIRRFADLGDSRRLQHFVDHLLVHVVKLVNIPAQEHEGRKLAQISIALFQKCRFGFFCDHFDHDAFVLVEPNDDWNVVELSRLQQVDRLVGQKGVGAEVIDDGTEGEELRRVENILITQDFVKFRKWSDCLFTFKIGARTNP